MKKSKIIIIIVFILFIVLGITLVVFLNIGNSNKIVSTLTLDINPSIEINLNKKKNIVSTKALNNDAEDILSDELNGKSLDDALSVITEKVIEKGYAEEGKVTILVTSTGEVDSNDVKGALEENFSNKEVTSDVIVIDNITEEDKKYASSHGISAAKAAYIIDIVRDYENITMESLVSKSVSEIKETKETGYYCDEGYTLNGDTCIKKIGEEKAADASVCPDGSIEVDGKCYKTVNPNEEAYCKNGLELKNGKCVGTERVNAKASCSTGTYNSNTGKCEVLTYLNAGTKSCKNADDLLLDNGRCAYNHPGAHSYGEEGEIDPATECCCGDTYHASPNPNSPSQGWCYSIPNGNYDAVISCSTGTYYSSGSNGAGCYKAETSSATYSCDNGTLEGAFCIVNTSKIPSTKLICSNGVLYQDRICIDKNNTVEKKQGYKCDKTPSKLVGSTCILYEVIDAKHN